MKKRLKKKKVEGLVVPDTKAYFDSYEFKGELGECVGGFKERKGKFL